MNTLYGKLVMNCFISIAVINLVFTSMDVLANNDFERNPLAKSQEQYGYLYPPKLLVEKKLSEFLGGPGKRSYYDEDYYTNSQSKRLSEFLGGPGKKRQYPSTKVDKRYSEFLGGPGK